MGVVVELPGWSDCSPFTISYQPSSELELLLLLLLLGWRWDRRCGLESGGGGGGGRASV